MDRIIGNGRVTAGTGPASANGNTFVIKGHTLQNVRWLALRYGPRHQSEHGTGWSSTSLQTVTKVRARSGFLDDMERDIRAVRLRPPSIMHPGDPLYQLFWRRCGLA
jgi:hypothetical protein